MRSVADDLRLRTIARVLDMPVAARVELTLSLGGDDLDLFVRTSGLGRDEARPRPRAKWRGGDRLIADVGADLAEQPDVMRERWADARR